MARRAGSDRSPRASDVDPCFGPTVDISHGFHERSVVQLQPALERVQPAEDDTWWHRHDRSVGEERGHDGPVTGRCPVAPAPAGWR